VVVKLLMEFMCLFGWACLRESMTHTKPEWSPWIQTDLFTNNYVFGVKIWDRSESLDQRCMHVHFNQQN